MVRQVSRRIVSQTTDFHKPVRANRIAPIPKSPLSSKGFHAKHSRGLVNIHANISASRYLKRKPPALPTIVEEEEEEVYTRPRRDIHRELDVLAGHKDQDEDDMDWDEETTLVALLRDEHSDHSDTEELAALADRLKGPLSAQSQQLRRYMAETIVPAVQQVKEVHDTMEEQVDMAYGTGLLAFDEVCKRVETMALRTEDDIRSEFIDSKKATDSLLARLAEAYQQRNALWTQLDDDLGRCAERVRASVEALPGEVENTITKLEKKRKEMEKNSSSAASRQKILKDLFQQLR